MIERTSIPHNFWQSNPVVLLRSLALVLSMSLLFAGCFLKPFSLVGKPCAKGLSEECPTGETCIRGTCRAIGAAECTDDTGCPCAMRCDASAQVCVNTKCSSDVECSRAGCEYHCDVSKQLCVKGPPPSAFCKSTEDCKGQICSGNRCSPCTGHDECEHTRLCDTSSGMCIKCKQNSDCHTALCDVQKGQCIPCQQDTDCKATAFCRKGVCARCTKGEDCATGRCDTQTGACQPCQQDDDCSTQLCLQGVCERCRSAQECKQGGCNAGVCAKNCQRDDECASNLCKNSVCTQCASADDCPQLRCADGRCLGPCRTNEDCTNGRTCEQGRCQRPNEGESCSAPLNCRFPYLCVTEGSGKVCRKPCSPLQGGCPTGQICRFLPRSSTHSGLCVPKYVGKKLEDECKDEDSKENSETCSPELTCWNYAGRQRCRKVCDPTKPSCASGNVCTVVSSQHKDIGLCFTRNCSNTPSLCQAGTKCINNQCQKVCSKDSDCGTGQICEGSACTSAQCGINGRACSAEQYCENFRCKKISSLPKLCSSNSTCSTSKEHCSGTPISRPRNSRCWDRCNSRMPCSSNYSCVSLPTSTWYKVCLPKNGGAKTLEPCDGITKRCENTHSCINLVGVPADGRCLSFCRPKTPNACGSGFQCVELRSYLGVCLKVSPIIGPNRPCGLQSGKCTSGYICYASTTGSDRKGYCRKNCTTGSCPSRYKCTTTNFTLLGKKAKLCVP